MLCPLSGSRRRCPGDRDGAHHCETIDDEELLNPEAEEFGRRLHLGAFGKGKRVLDVDTKITNSGLDLGVTKQDLHSAQVASLFISSRARACVRPWRGCRIDSSMSASISVIDRAILCSSRGADSGDDVGMVPLGDAQHRGADIRSLFLHCGRRSQPAALAKIMFNAAFSMEPLSSSAVKRV
jgi:hypothetical protein